ncbi:MAG: YbaK/EbsC family protein [Hahellaceae bacterium]|nr:YbaK/EbsC family protein [Hahellaceae bacterium]
MALPKLLDFLTRMHARFTLEVHSPAYTAQEVAERIHTHGIHMAKVVVLRIDGELALLVLPAHYHVACEHLATELGAERVDVAPESSFLQRFGQCEPGAIPPFAQLWDIPLFMSDAFHEQEELAFNAGSWSEVVRMPCDEYLRIAHPEIIETGAQPPSTTPKRVKDRPGRLAVHFH